MTTNEIVYWTIWAVLLGLFLALYLRVDWHDWGAVGLTGFTFGILLLVSTIIYRYYGGTFVILESLLLWKFVVLVFAPLALIGYIAGFIRDPVPPGQITRRLLGLAVALMVIYIVLDIFTRSS